MTATEARNIRQAGHCYEQCTLSGCSNFIQQDLTGTKGAMVFLGKNAYQDMKAECTGS